MLLRLPNTSTTATTPGHQSIRCFFNVRSTVVWFFRNVHVSILQIVNRIQFRTIHVQPIPHTHTFHVGLFLVLYGWMSMCYRRTDTYRIDQPYHTNTPLPIARFCVPVLQEAHARFGHHHKLFQHWWMCALWPNNGWFLFIHSHSKSQSHTHGILLILSLRFRVCKCKNVERIYLVDGWIYIYNFWIIG